MNTSEPEGYEATSKHFKIYDDDDSSDTESDSDTETDSEKYTVEGNPIEEEEVVSDFSNMEVTQQTDYLGPLSPLVEPSYNSKWFR